MNDVGEEPRYEANCFVCPGRNDGGQHGSSWVLLWDVRGLRPGAGGVPYAVPGVFDVLAVGMAGDSVLDGATDLAAGAGVAGVVGAGADPGAADFSPSRLESLSIVMTGAGRWRWKMMSRDTRTCRIPGT